MHRQAPHGLMYFSLPVAAYRSQQREAACAEPMIAHPAFLPASIGAPDERRHCTLAGTQGNCLPWTCTCTTVPH